MTHVASNRHVGENRPTVGPIKFGEFHRWYEENRKLHEWLKTAERKPIGLPHDGEQFVDNSLEEMLQRLLQLREIGYHVPEHAIAGIRDEMAEGSAPAA